MLESPGELQKKTLILRLCPRHCLSLPEGGVQASIAFKAPRLFQRALCPFTRPITHWALDDKLQEGISPNSEKLVWSLNMDDLKKWLQLIMI